MAARTVSYIAVCVVVLLVILLTSIPRVRCLLAAPLVVSDPAAKGDACYVLAGGRSIWERLDAAADLVQMGRVSRVLLMQDGATGQYSFKSNSSWTKSQWMADYLAWRGVPKEKIIWLPHREGRFGTLTEARTVALHLPKDLKSLVLVSSAPHMRRSMLAFRRSLPAGITVIPYMATEFINSYEMYHPIWLEYVKLFVYYVVA